MRPLRSPAARGLALAALLLLGSCGGGGGGGGGGPALTYTTPVLLARQGDAITPDLPITGGAAATSFTVAPALPTGLLLDPASGAISGTPLAPAATGTYTVSAMVGGSATSAPVTVQVTPPLPATFTSLEPGFHVETVLTGGPVVLTKMAFAPDGRLFFNELTTGNIRVIDAGGTLVATPVATMAVVTGVEQGLLGLALSPTFATDGYLYVYASVNVGGPGGDRNRLVRWTVGANNVASSPVVIVDGLPIGSTGHNGGDVELGPDGLIYVTVGDTGDSNTSQDPLSLAGRVLRYTPAGAIPATNPIAGSPEYCRGLRNTFDLCFHPVTGGLFGAENGPTVNDEINFIQAGRNYLWPADPGGVLTGYRIKLYPEVIAPTSIAFYTAAPFGAEYANNLFIGGYVNADIRRLKLSGAAFTDVDYERPFAALVNVGLFNKPIHLLVGPEGALYVSTVDSIYRIKKYP